MPLTSRSSQRRFALVFALLIDCMLVVGCVDASDVQQTATLAAQSNGPSNDRSRSPEAHRSRSLYQDYPPSGVYMGQGWDSFTNQGTSASCVAVEEIPIEASSYVTNAREIKSSLSVFKDSSIAIAGSYSGAVGSVSASMQRQKSHYFEADKFHFLFEFTSDASSTFAIPSDTVTSRLDHPDSRALLASLSNENVQNRVIDQLTDISQYRGSRFELTDAARTLYAENPENFFKVCGQGFVSAIYRGARLQVVISSESHRREDKEKLRTSLRARGYGAKLSVDTANNSQRQEAASSIQATVFQEGGFPIAPPANFSELDAVFENAEALLSSPKAYRVRITPYQDLLMPGGTWGPALPKELKELTDYYLVLRDVYRLAMDVYQRYIEAELTGLTPAQSTYSTVLVDAYSGRMVNNEFEAFENGRDYLRDLTGEIQMHLAFVEAAIERCYQDTQECANFDRLLRNMSADVSGRRDELMTKFAQESDETRSDLAGVLQDESQVYARARQADAEAAFAAADGPIPLTRAAAAVYALTVNINAAQDPQGQELRSLSADVETLAREEDARTEAYTSQLAYYSGLDSVESLNGTFYTKVYDFLARIPLPESTYTLGLNTVTRKTSRSWKHGKYRKTEVTTTISGALTPLQQRIRDNPAGVLKDLIVVERLLPWASYFCEESISHRLCLDLGQLEQFADVPLNEQLIRDTLQGNLNYSVVRSEVSKSRRGGLAGWGIH